MISNNFNAYYGDPAYTNSHNFRWPYGIWAHYSNIPTEAMCAFKCYADTGEHP